MQKPTSTPGEFVGYVGDPRIHDGIIQSIQVDNQKLDVVVKAYDGPSILVEFYGVESIRQNLAEDMILYALSEMKTTPPLRHFVFVNSDDDSEAFLEVLARGLATSDVVDVK
jgi:hypothetical protein